MLSLLGHPVAVVVHNDVRLRALAFLKKAGRKPKLSVVLVGEDPASVVYTRKKGEAAAACGFDHETISLPASSTPKEVQSRILALNAAKDVDGILIQRPLPQSFQEREVLYWIDPRKDVDAFHPENAGRLNLGLPCFAPCTPSGILEILKFYSIPIAGRLCCIIGRSSIVGKPLASLLIQGDATVLLTHSKTLNLPSLTQQADILIAAIGKPEFLTGHFVKPGAVVIDVGINRLPSGKLVGDVLHSEVSTRASALTPVPGGVGPMTIAILLKNTILAAESSIC